MNGGAVWKDLFASSSLTLVRADYAPDLWQRPHAHDYTSVSLMLGGAVEERVGTRETQASTFSVCIKQAGVVHACRWGTKGARMFSVELPAGSCVGDTETTVPPWAVLRRPEPVGALLTLYRSWARNRLSSEADEADDLVVELVPTLTLARPARRPGAPPRWLSIALEEMYDTCPRRPSTAGLAKRNGVHPVHFARVFREYLGMPPTTFARWLRVRAAASTLGSRERSAAEAAALCGFADQSHLCREFRAFVGLTPSGFRRLTSPVDG